MRKKDDPGYQVDWTKFDEVSFKQRNVRAPQLSPLCSDTIIEPRREQTGASDQARHNTGTVQ